MRKPAISAMSLVAVLLLNISVFAQLPAVIQTASGSVAGTVTKQKISLYRGIPFAQPPVGDLRWEPPQPLKSWTGVRKCDAFGPSPMQPSPAPFSMWSQEFLIPKEPISEDCLYLNVWSGAKNQKAKLPVLVWIYGGGFSSGGSAVPIYDGEAFAAKGVVFVSINYRVGVFGFLAHPALTMASQNKASGNYGLMDQVAALEWVKANIAAFGGDPANVTIAGQSAGSMSVNCLVATPLAKGLFNKAIAQSGASFTNAAVDLKNAELEGLRIQTVLGVKSIAEMRAIPAENLLKNAKGQFRPVTDGYVLPASISEIFKTDRENNVALLTGWNQDEGLLFGPLQNAVEFRKQASLYGPDSSKFLKYYPAENDGQAATSQLNLSRDQIFGAQNYAWATIAAAKSRHVYVYRFTRKVPATGEYVKYGAFHTGEVPYAYNNLQFVNRPWQKEDRQLSTTMSSYWINFIRQGDPNGAGLPSWPAFDSSTKQVIYFDKEVKASTISDSAALDFLIKDLRKQHEL